MAATLANQATIALRAAHLPGDWAAHSATLMVQSDHYAEAAQILATTGLALDPIDFSDGEPTFLTAATITRI